jgi:hypothetical protein
MPFSEGVAPVRAGTVIDTPKAALFGLAGSWRFIGRDGTKFGREFTMSLPFSEGLAAVGLGGAHAMDRPPKFGYFSLQGTLAIPAQFMSCQPFSEGLAVVEAMTQLKGYVDLRGNAVIPARYRWAGKFSRGRALVLEGDDHFIINAKGEQVAALACDQVQAFAFFEGMSAIAQHGKWGFVDDNGRLLIPCQFEAVGPFCEGLAAAVEAGKLGFINREGHFVIRPQFDAPQQARAINLSGTSSYPYFSEGLAALAKDGRWGYIDRDAQWVIPPQFDLAGAFTEGAAKVAVGNKLGYIDRRGEYIWKPTR